MIQIGLVGWSYHDTITPHSKGKLTEYAKHFPVVEMDTSFYAIPPQKNISSWITQTPESFQFIVKAYAPLTTHESKIKETRPLGELFEIYKATFEPMVESGKVKAFLFQFPPNFTCRKENVDYLRLVRRIMGPLPIAVEFRHHSWYSEEFQKGTLQFLKEMNFIHVVVDQPQTPHNSVPFVPIATNPDLTILRLHGRNYEGWLGDDSKNWRTFRTLYDYNEEELEEIKQAAMELEKDSKEVTVIFNNNSGGHAAPNAKKLQQLLGMKESEEASEQLDLF